MNPKFPVFIPTKGRYESRYTIEMFNDLGVDYTIFVEDQEHDLYAQHVPEKRIHVVPHRDQGLTVTRNYIWDFAEREGYEWYWTFDDNITRLLRYNHNTKIPCTDGTVMAVIENFVARYVNIAVAGMNYRFFVNQRRGNTAPYYLNTRVYSNMLINTFATDVSGDYFRNDLFYNDDTDLCLRMLKSDWCTVLFNAFLIEKKTTMTVKGGNTDYYDQTDERLEFAEELKAAHPDCVATVRRWGRWHHYVDYSKFTQKLRRRLGVQVPSGVNNFGMVLQERVNDAWVDVE